MSTTPRTTAALEWVRPAGNDSGPPNEQYVCADVARTLETELAEAKAEAAHYMSVAQKATDDLARLRADNLTAHQMACAAGLERDQLRAEVKRWQAEAEEMSAQRSHNANQAGRLRAELAVAKNWVEHHSKHADDLIAENVRLRAEVERLMATLSAIEEDGTSEHNAAVGLRQNLVAVLALYERAEAERDALAKDKARLDWLSVSDAWFDYPATGAFTPDTMRAAIDAAMKP